MRPRPSFRSASWVATTAILVVVMLARSAHGQASYPPSPLLKDAGGGSPTSPQPVPPPSRILISDGRLKRAAELALQLALARTANGCRGLLSEFVDQRGQPLSTRLEALRMTLRDFLQTVLFVDGGGHRACQGPVAVTMPGSRVVYLCGALAGESRNDAWVVMVHEALHSLGLAENPPTPTFISDLVRQRCR